MSTAITETEVKATREDAQESFLKGVAKLLTEEGIETWVKIRASLKYSSGNIARIMGSRDEVTYPACRTDWKKYGREVVPGAEAMYIFNRPFRAASKTPNKDGSPKFVNVFTVAGIYDQADTVVVNEKLWAKYEPLLWKKVKRTTLPEDYEPQPIEGDSHKAALKGLRDLAKAEGWKFVVSDAGLDVANGNLGRCEFGTKTIRVAASMSVNQQVAVGIHELAHALGNVDYARYSRPEAEGIVETIAYAVCSTIGLDTSKFSLGYVAHWLGAVRTAPGDTVKRIKKQLEAVDKMAVTIEKAVTVAMGIAPERLTKEEAAA